MLRQKTFSSFHLTGSGLRLTLSMRKLATDPHRLTQTNKKTLKAAAQDGSIQLLNYLIFELILLAGDG
jgi:hypothetical protein